MVPMRSVPFKIICILGLNDGEYPRQRVPLGFDLIAQNPPRPGDRSRRADDRYLFLEALISCREKLYLSYQGKDIKDNSDKEPSIILKELMDYLEQGYQWQFTAEQQLNQCPLQAFSRANYLGKYPSFDANWARLAQPQIDRDNLLYLEESELADDSITLQQLINYFNKPLHYFARYRLQLTPAQLDFHDADSEPFSSDPLNKYQLRHDYLQAFIDQASPEDLQLITLKAKLSGQLPDNYTTDSDLHLWQQQAEEFHQQVAEFVAEEQSVTLQLGKYQIAARLPLTKTGDQQVFYRLTTPKGKDYIKLYLHHLLAQLTKQQPITTTGYFYQEKNKRQPIKQLSLPALSAAQAQQELLKLLDIFAKGQLTPLFIPADLALAAFTQKDRTGQHKPLSQNNFEQLWYGSQQMSGYWHDDIIKFFYSECPSFNKDILPLLTQTYQTMCGYFYPKLSVSNSGACAND
jgi:exodeoxyribonuclease V gamma subunit